MFFMIGIAQEQRQLPYQQNIICTRCGKFGRYEVFVAFSCLRLFFIPILRWNRQYYVRSTCCGTLWQLSPEKGRALEHHADVTIEAGDLTPLHTQSRQLRRCPVCGYETADPGFTFCPKCGNRMDIL